MHDLQCSIRACMQQLSASAYPNLMQRQQRANSHVNVCCQGVIGQITRICRRHFKFFDGFKVVTLNRDLR